MVAALYFVCNDSIKSRSINCKL